MASLFPTVDKSAERLNKFSKLNALGLRRNTGRLSNLAGESIGGMLETLGGYESPQDKVKKVRQKTMEAGLEVGTPDYYKFVSDSFAQEGMLDQAEAAYKMIPLPASPTVVSKGAALVDSAGNQLFKNEEALKTDERKTFKDANGRVRYLDDKSLVVPDLVVEPDEVSTSGEERINKLITKLRIKERDGTITPDEKIELTTILQPRESKRFSSTTTDDGSKWVYGADGVAVQVKGAGDALVTLDIIKERRHRKTAEANNKNQLNVRFDERTKPDIRFIKNTQALATPTGRESIDDLQLTYMFADLLDPGSDIAQGDLGKIADTAGFLDEKIKAGLRGIAAGQTVLDPDVRKNMEKSIKLARAVKARNIREVIKSLKKEASDVGMVEFTPIGAPEGSEFNPFSMVDMSDKEIRELKGGSWIIDEDDNQLKQL
tara:strand:- start:4171 stop:5463 length:1293 start_codon:yes stop_codon:yes gene_type:complete